MRTVLFLAVSVLFFVVAALLVRKGIPGMPIKPSGAKYGRFFAGIFMGVVVGLVPLVKLREPGPSVLVFLLTIAVGGTIGALLQTRR